jgi:Peptidase inhibitor family I36
MMRRRALHLAAAATAAAVGVAIAPPAASADSPTCPDKNACFWTDSGYTGSRTIIGASYAGTGWHRFANSKFSAKSRFNNKWVCLSDGSRGIGDLTPGENIIFVGGIGINYFKVKNNPGC